MPTSTVKPPKRHGPIAALAAWLDLYTAETRSRISAVEAAERDDFEQELLQWVPDAEAREGIRQMALELFKSGVNPGSLPEMLRHYHLSLQTWVSGRMHMVDGACPWCGLHYLRFDVGTGMLRCAAPGCGNRFAASFILSEEETEHIVEVDDERFHVKHPLRERIGDALLTCTIHQALTEASPAFEPGRYRVGHGKGEDLLVEVLS